ncbi:hypothetical protein AGOR_G00098680 [Albula goreensis]|uniref:Uncharacterized protein n=1 Tax=Albula goreensis TaxID=1534307 RepID=A0A8T3DIQ7_9TELE|nr:hypothetical protein AGOR_G00098680 [Albula goreensis]
MTCRARSRVLLSLLLLEHQPDLHEREWPEARTISSILVEDSADQLLRLVSKLGGNQPSLLKTFAFSTSFLRKRPPDCPDVNG